MYVYINMTSVLSSYAYWMICSMFISFVHTAVYVRHRSCPVTLSLAGDQPLLDVRFPDVSRHGQGVHLNSFNDPSKCWRKLTLWHVLNAEGMQLKKEVPKIKTLNVSTKNYEQTYCILKSAWDSSSPTLSVHHDVLFRFGSWCYSGKGGCSTLYELTFSLLTY